MNKITIIKNLVLNKVNERRGGIKVFKTGSKCNLRKKL